MEAYAVVGELSASLVQRNLLFAPMNNQGLLMRHCCQKVLDLLVLTLFPHRGSRMMPRFGNRLISLCKRRRSSFGVNEPQYFSLGSSCANQIAWTGISTSSPQIFEIIADCQRLDYSSPFQSWIDDHGPFPTMSSIPKIISSFFTTESVGGLPDSADFITLIVSAIRCPSWAWSHPFASPALMMRRGRNHRPIPFQPCS